MLRVCRPSPFRVSGSRSYSYQVGVNLILASLSFILLGNRESTAVYQQQVCGVQVHALARCSESGTLSADMVGFPERNYSKILRIQLFSDFDPSCKDP
jgi:hypothetical protein